MLAVQSIDNFDSLKLRTMSSLLEVKDFSLMKSLFSVVQTFCGNKEDEYAELVRANVADFLSNFRDKALLADTVTSPRNNGTIIIDWNSDKFAAGLNIGENDFSYAAVRFADNKDFSGSASLDNKSEIEKFVSLIHSLYYAD